MPTMPIVRDYMTPMPLMVDASAPVSRAVELMQTENIRHLIVLRNGKFAGVADDREVKIAQAFPGPGELAVGDVMDEMPYIVDFDSQLDDILFEMVEHKYSCALVRDEYGTIVGIFTASDALEAFGEQLRERYSSIAA